MSIRITARAAYDLARSAALLFHQGTGIVLEPTDELTGTDEGFIDSLEPDSDIRYWANQLLFFARTVHGIFNLALLTQEEELLENEI